MAKQVNLSTWVAVVVMSVLTVACGQKDIPSLNEVQVVNILYTDLTNRAHELYGPTPIFEVRKAEIGWAFYQASSVALDEILEEQRGTLQGIISGTPSDLPVMPDMGEIMLRNDNFETTGWMPRIQAGGLSRLAKYVGDGWWNVTLGNKGKWRINETTNQVEPTDEEAKALDQELSIGIAELKPVLEYLGAIGGYRERYVQILNTTVQAMDLTGEGLLRDKALSTLYLADDVAQLKSTISAIPVPRLGEAHSMLELEALDLLEAGLSRLGITYGESAQVTYQQATKDKEFGEQALAEYREGVRLIKSALAKWDESSVEEDRLLTYIEKRQKQLQPNR